MTNPYAPPRRDSDHALGRANQLRERGRLFVALICAGIGVFAVMSLLFSAVSGAGLLRLALTAGLVYALYQGQNWARVLTAVLLGVGGLFGVVAMVDADFGLGARGVLVAAMLVFYFGAAGMLLLSPAISAFFRVGRFQRFEGDSE